MVFFFPLLARHLNCVGKEINSLSAVAKAAEFRSSQSLLIEHVQHDRRTIEQLGSKTMKHNLRPRLQKGKKTQQKNKKQKAIIMACRVVTKHLGEEVPL